MRWHHIYHPILFAAFPILSLYAANMDTVAARELVLPLALSVLGGLLSYAALAAWMRSPARAAVLVSFGTCLFWNLNALHEALVRLLSGTIPVPYRLAVGLAAILFLALAFGVWRLRHEPRNANQILNWVGLALLLMPIGIVTWTSIQQRGGTAPRELEARWEELGDLPDTVRTHPDIYYIVLDACGRADVLRQAYGLEGALAGQLAERGFYVASQSTANYPTTLHSIPSALNLDYIQSLVPEGDDLPAAPRYFTQLVEECAVRRILRPYGYRFVVYSSGYFLTECPGADVRVRPRWGLTEFQAELVNRTPLRALERRLRFASPYQTHRNRILETLHRLPERAENEVPEFILAHILTPHHPFIFDEEGQDVSPRHRPYRLNDGGVGGVPVPVGEASEEYITGYRRQLVYISRRVSEMVDRILEASEDPPIIIIQGDHGPNSHWPRIVPAERFPILNAYYLPGDGARHLYPSITPVNTFRVILAHYFGLRFEPLPDLCYLADYRHAFDFEPVEQPR